MEITAEGNCYVPLSELLVEESWLKALPGEFHKPYAKSLSDFLEREIITDSKSPLIYPPQHLIFNALNTTPFDRVKTVIIGQVHTTFGISFGFFSGFCFYALTSFFTLFDLGSLSWTWSSYGFVLLCT